MGRIRAANGRENRRPKSQCNDLLFIVILGQLVSKVHHGIFSHVILCRN